jgi:hypothetical protein
MSRKLTALDFVRPDVTIEVTHAQLAKWPAGLYDDLRYYAFDTAETKTGYRFSIAAYVYDELAAKYAPKTSPDAPRA